MTGLEATQVFSHDLNISFKFEKCHSLFTFNITLTIRKIPIFLYKTGRIFLEKDSMQKIEVNIGLNQLLE